MSTPAQDAYGPNFRKARNLAILRSDKKCQFCGLRRAKEGHHWSWPIYPSDEEVQAHHITALCKPCHELATILRSWAGKGHADLNTLAGALENATNFYGKRKILSCWLFPEGEESMSIPKEEDAIVQSPSPEAVGYIPAKQENVQTNIVRSHSPPKAAKKNASLRRSVSFFAFFLSSG